VEDRCSDDRELRPLPSAEAAARRVSDLWDVQQASGHRRLTGSPPAPATGRQIAARVACDLYGCGELRLVAAGIRVALDTDPDLTVFVVGLADDIALAFGDAVPDRVEVVPGVPLDAPATDAVRAIRGRRDAAVRVAARLVRDGSADACVLAGRADVGFAAATFALSLLPGATRPVLAADIGPLLAAPGPVFLLDVSGRSDGDPAGFAQSALLGSGVARARTGIDRPAVAALVGSRASVDDAGRRRALGVLDKHAEAGLFRFVGPIDVSELRTAPQPPQVVITDGFSGNVLREALSVVGGGPTEARAAAAGTTPTPRGGGLVVGLEGVVVLGEATAGVPAEVYADAIALAAQAHRDGVVRATAASLADLVAWRRMSAGLNPVLP
jgi:fatty acid/phospholipid biosynthesis enzyme